MARYNLTDIFIAISVFAVLSGTSIYSFGDSPSKIGCEHNGEFYDAYDTKAFIDPTFYEFDEELGMSPKEAKYSEEGYAILAVCSPVLDLTKIDKGQFTTEKLPVLRAEWVLSDMFSAFDRPDIELSK